MANEILLHHCCVVCTPEVLKYFKQKFDKVISLWFNPNIYPQEEFNKRLEALKIFTEQERQFVIIKTNFNSALFDEIKDSCYDEFKRCSFCYTFRLKELAKEAKNNNIKYFSTTLLASPYQKHDIIKKIGEDISSEYKIEFVYKDFRPDYYTGKSEIFNRKLYMQKYCGCIFSLNQKRK